jgi:hypothetical protein
MAMWVEDIIQALENLGGQAHRSQILEEIKRIRTEPLPIKLRETIQERIQAHSSDSKHFQGKDYFKKIGNGIWALRDQPHVVPVSKLVISNPPNPTKQNNPRGTSIEIASVLHTLNQFRDYKSPYSSDWKDYVHEIFQVFGFSINEITSQLFILEILGDFQTHKAVVIFINPEENFEEIITRIDWETHLMFSTNFYQIKWGILTNGLEQKIYDCSNKKTELKFYWRNFDQIIQCEKLDEFIEIHSFFSSVGSLKSGLMDSKNSKNSKEKNESEKQRIEFWKQLIDKGNKQGVIKGNKSPNAFNWISIPSGKSGLTYDCVLRKQDSEVQLYIDKKNIKKNKEFFSNLLQNKEKIEHSFGASLDWQRLDSKRASHISYIIEGSGFDDVNRWDELQDKMLEVLIRFKKSFNPYISL